MNISNALIILKLNNKYNIHNILELTNNELKKSYHINALIYHPDKNKAVNSSNSFQKIHEAYNYLHKLINTKKDNIYTNDEANETKYNIILINFINILIKNYTNNNEIDELDELNEINDIQFNVKKFKKDCIDYSYTLIENILDKLNIDLLEEIFNILNNKNLIYHNITNTKAIELIKKILLKKLKDFNIFIINPNLKNLLNSDVYKLIINQETQTEETNKEELYIPLWHNELNYNNNIIKIHPIIQDNVEIDNENNIIITYNNSFTVIQKLVEKYEYPYFEIIVEHFNLMIPLKELKIIKNQTYIFNNIGIPKLNFKDIFDNSNKAKIIININLS
tara:strand:- start:498 stop:1505 length:1008 start_codon:yes stop_codon:yes gene_type:complete